jgi:hypothetical protein
MGFKDIWLQEINDGDIGGGIPVVLSDMTWGIVIDALTEYMEHGGATIREEVQGLIDDIQRQSGEGHPDEPTRNDRLMGGFRED